MIHASGATPVRVRLQPPAFDLDVEAIVAALGPRTRAVIINTPHNPTGRIYPAADLQHLADGLAEAAERYGSPIWVISDEADSRILLDGRSFPAPAFSTRIRCSHTPTAKAPWPRHSGSASSLWRLACQKLRSCAGHCSPTVSAWHPTRSCNMRCKTSTACSSTSLRSNDVATVWWPSCGSKVMRCRFLRGPSTCCRGRRWPTTAPFARFLPRREFVLPGHVVELPGYFRISLTATDEMVERSLPISARAIERARSWDAMRPALS